MNITQDSKAHENRQLHTEHAENECVMEGLKNYLH
jgi:hypothetical protein